MSEQSPTMPTVLVDREAGERFHHIIEVGQNKDILGDSAITDSSRQITENDIARVATFHYAVSPANPEAPWRITQQQEKSVTNGGIIDPSSYGNWEAPGGPLEHIILASNAAAFIIREIRTRLKSEDEADDIWAKEAIRQLQTIEPLHAAAAAALHDEGREVTHLYYTNELIGRALLQKVGVREDLLRVMPTEQVMLVPYDIKQTEEQRQQQMNEVIQGLLAETVIVRLADEFGKRAPGKDRLYLPEDYDAWDRQTWANNYINRPLSGRPSDRWMRGQMQLHVDNVPRYFHALDTWIQAVSTTTLADLTQSLNEELAPSLAPLPQKNNS